MDLSLKCQKFQKLQTSLPCSLLLHALVLGFFSYNYAPAIMTSGITSGTQVGARGSAIKAMYLGKNSGQESQKIIEVPPKPIVKSRISKKVKKSLPTPSNETRQQQQQIEGQAVENLAQGASNIQDFNHSVINFKEPVYPRQAIRRGLEGMVKVKIEVSSEGLPRHIEIIKSSGHGILDKSVLDTVPHWRFQKTEGLSYIVEKAILFKIQD